MMRVPIPSRPRAQPAGILDEPPGQAPRGEPTTLLTLFAVLRRRFLWVLQGLIIVPLLVGILTLRQEAQYTAAAGLLFRDSAAALLEDASGGSFEDPTREAATNDDLVTLPAIAGLAARRFDRRPERATITAQEVADSVSVSPSAESDFVEIESRHPNPNVAAALANDYGNSYIQFRREADQEQLQNAVELVEERLAGLPPGELAGATGQELRSRLDDLRLAQGLQTGKAELVQRASVPSEPSSPDVRRNLALGLLLGMIVGVGSAVMRDRVDQSVRGVEELEELYGLPILARVPQTRRLGRSEPLEHGRGAEAFRTLRANLRFFNVDGGLRSLLIASPASGDGKSTVAAGLTRTMAAMGDSVLLIEADLHKPSPTAGEAPGLSSVLAGTLLEDALINVPVSGTSGGEGRELTVLPSGPVPPNPLELLESRRMEELLEDVARDYDYVIIDSPALSDISDARVLVAQVSGIIAVSALARTTRGAATDFRKQLALLQCNALGVVANRAPVRRDGYYYSS